MNLPHPLPHVLAPSPAHRRPRYVPVESPGLDDDMDAQPDPELDLDLEREDQGVIPDDEERVVQVPT